METATKNFIFIDHQISFPLLAKYAKKLKEELESIADPQASVLVRLFLSNKAVPFKPNEGTILALLGSSVALVRQNALYCFDAYYAKELDSLENHNFWLSGSVENYKLTAIRKILKEQGSKIVTRFSKNVDVLLLGEKSKLEVLPSELMICSTFSFAMLLDMAKDIPLEVVGEKEKIDETNESLLVEKLLLAEEDELLELLNSIEKGTLIGDVLSLVVAMYKVHPQKNIRLQGKVLLEREASKCTKELLAFCETRNYLNAKYTVGMEELEKIKGFEIDLFLYYLVKVQKNHLGKEYLARIDSHWTERFLEESALLNKKKLELFSKAGERFIMARNIEEFRVHGNSDVLWKMDWLRYLEIMESKEALILPKKNSFSSLDTLVLESKEIVLSGSLAVKVLEIKKCKTLKIEENFSLNFVESLSFEGSSFSMSELKNFFEAKELPLLKQLSFKGFANYKIPKDWKGFLSEKFVGVELLLA